MKYEMMLSLKPTLYRLTPPEQFAKTCPLLHEIFRDYKATIVTGLTQEHNVHYHVMVYLETLYDKDALMNRFRKHAKVFGRKSCKQVMYEDSYIEYMKKNLREAEPIILFPLVKDNYGICSIQEF